MKPLVIFGNKQAAEIANFYFQTDSNRDVVAFTVDQTYIDDAQFQGLPVVPFETITETYPPDQYDMFVALGYSKLNMVREQKYNEAKAKGYTLANYISSRATVLCPPDNIGDNVFLLEDNTIQPFVKIGNNITLWSGNHIGHHSQIDDHGFITSHVVVSGNVKIGKNCFIGVNATLRDAITVGDHVLIGAAAWINRDVPDQTTCTNPPAKFRERQERAVEKI